MLEIYFMVESQVCETVFNGLNQEKIIPLKSSVFKDFFGERGGIRTHESCGLPDCERRKNQGILPYIR